MKKLPQILKYPEIYVASEWEQMMSADPEKDAETDEQYIHRIRAEAREKMLKSSRPLNVESLLRSMEIEEPTHLGNLSKRPSPSE